MRKALLRSAVVLLATLHTAAAQSVPANAPYRDARLPVDARVRDLVARMTPDEKFWQLYLSPGDRDNPAHDYSHGAFGLQITLGSSPIPNGTSAARYHTSRINAIQHVVHAHCTSGGGDGKGQHTVARNQTSRVVGHGRHVAPAA